MKGRTGLSSFRRLHHLLSNSGISRSGGRSCTLFSGQLSNGSSSSSENSRQSPVSELSENSSRQGVVDRAIADLPALGLFYSFRSSPPLLSGVTPFAVAAVLHCPSVSSSHRQHHSLFRDFPAPFATVREKVDEEEEVGGHDKPEGSQPWRPSQRKSAENEASGSTSKLGINEASGSTSELGSKKASVSPSEIGSNDAKLVLKGYEDEVGSQGLESGEKMGWTELGWTSKDVLNWPNAISTARLLSGPVLAWMILHGLWSSALVGLVIAGISDWLDGYVARKMDINSVLGSYLDPVADKCLVGSVAMSMAYTGLLHPALVGLIVARDGVLVAGAFVYRAYSLGWQWNHWREFFRIGVGGAGKIEPLFISKLNTVFQLALVGVALLQPALSMEDTYSLVPFLSGSVVATTSMSWGAYAYIYLKNPENLAALRHSRIPKMSQRSTSVPLK